HSITADADRGLDGGAAGTGAHTVIGHDCRQSDAGRTDAIAVAGSGAGINAIAGVAADAVAVLSGLGIKASVVTAVAVAVLGGVGTEANAIAADAPTVLGSGGTDASGASAFTVTVQGAAEGGNTKAAAGLAPAIRHLIADDRAVAAVNRRRLFDRGSPD